MSPSGRSAPLDQPGFRCTQGSPVLPARSETGSPYAELKQAHLCLQAPLPPATWNDPEPPHPLGSPCHCPHSSLNSPFFRPNACVSQGPLPSPDCPPHRCSLLDAPVFWGKKKPQREGNSAHDQSPVTPLMIIFPAQPWTEFCFSSNSASLTEL